PAQPSALQALPITLTLKSGTTEGNYTSATDPNGNFTVVADLPGGTYQWRVKGPNAGPGGNTTPAWLANSGTLTLVRGASSTEEMGLMRAGDCNNDNVVNIQDVGILRNTFNKSPSDTGYDARADFNGDNMVNISDYNLLKG